MNILGLSPSNIKGDSGILSTEVVLVKAILIIALTITCFEVMIFFFKIITKHLWLKFGYKHAKHKNMLRQIKILTIKIIF